MSITVGSDTQSTCVDCLHFASDLVELTCQVLPRRETKEGDQTVNRLRTSHRRRQVRNQYLMIDQATDVLLSLRKLGVRAKCDKCAGKRREGGTKPRTVQQNLQVITRL